MPEDYNLERLDAFRRLLDDHRELLYPEQLGKGGVEERSLHCSGCCERRRMKVKTLSVPSAAYRGPVPPLGLGGFGGTPPKNRTRAVDVDELTPSLFRLECCECQCEVTALVYRGPEGASLAVLPSTFGGLSTLNTPEGVRFYLDQAHRAQSVGAYSAAVAMYRAALEHLLFEQGFKKRNLAPKISELETAITKADNSTPKWAKDMDTRFLTLIKDLGNAAIHPNHGNVEKQATLHSGLLTSFQATFIELLDVVYEAEERQNKRRAAMQDAKAKFDS